MNYMDVLYGIENPLFMDLNGDAKYLLTTLLPWFVRYQTNIGKIGKLNQPVAVYLRQFTSNQALIDMIVQHFFKDTPTFFGLSYFGLYLDYNYPIGGTGVLPNKLCTKIKELGGEFLINTGIISVDSRNKTIQTSGGETYEYDKLIWAANQKTLYSILEEEVLQDVSTGISWETQKQKVSSHRGNDSVLTFYFGVNQSPQHYDDICGPHMFFTPDPHGLSSLSITDWKQITSDDSLTDDQRQMALQRWTSNYLDLTTFEISIPALRDAALAPEGKTGIITSTLFEYDLAKYLEQKGWYDAWKDAAKAHMIKLLASSIFPGFAENLSFGLTSSPLTIERFSGNADGAITGWAFSKDGTPAENRFKKIRRAVLTPLADIYQAGQWTFSPSGLPISILTGKVAADLVHQERKRKLKQKRPAPIEPEIITT
jgi:phytoene dehydrogenase-like protein